MAVISNIFIDAGTDFSTTVTVTDSTGSAVNLSGYSHASRYVSHTIHPLRQLRSPQRPLMHQQRSIYTRIIKLTNGRKDLMVDTYMMQL